MHACDTNSFSNSDALQVRSQPCYEERVDPLHSLAVCAVYGLTQIKLAVSTKKKTPHTRTHTMRKVLNLHIMLCVSDILVVLLKCLVE